MDPLNGFVWRDNFTLHSRYHQISKMRLLNIIVTALSACSSLASALTISQINGYRYLSSYDGVDITGIKGLVTAKGPSGFFLKSTTLDLDMRSSNSIYVYGYAAAKNVTVGDIITLDATVSEYRSSPDYIYLTELEYPNNVKVLSVPGQQNHSHCDW
jgi:predicted extracellular nuclease